MRQAENEGDGETPRSGARRPLTAGALARALPATRWAPCRPGRVAIQDSGAGLKVLLDYAWYCPAVSGRLELEEDWTDLFGERYQTIATVRTPQGSGGEHLLGQGSLRISVDRGVRNPTGLAGFVHLG